MIQKTLFNINDIVKFYNMNSYSLLSMKCPKCSGSKKISYYSADNKLNEISCNKCGSGHGYVEVEKMVLPKSINDAKVSFGKITGFKIDLNNKTIYDIQPFFCDSNPLCKFFATEDGDLYSFLHEFCDTQIEEENIICAEKQEDSLVVDIPEYNYNINEKNVVFFNSETHIKTPCKTCNGKDYVFDSDKKLIKCPFFTWHYSCYENKETLQQGIVTDIYYLVKLNKNPELRNDYLKYYCVDFCYLEFKNKSNPNEWSLSQTQKGSRSLGGARKFITKDLNEALFLLDEL